jgi:hypothetical protein
MTLGRYAHKRRYRMHPAMLRCFIALRLTEDADENLRKLKNEQRSKRKELVKAAQVRACALGVWGAGRGAW